MNNGFFNVEMLVTPFRPTIAQRFEAGIAGLALACRAYEAHTQVSTDRFWQWLEHQITQNSPLDRPLPSPPNTPTLDLPGWSYLSYLPWLWIFLGDEEGQQAWLKQQPNPHIALLLAGFEQLSRDPALQNELRNPLSYSPRYSPDALLSAFPVAQGVWQTAVDLTARSSTLAQGLAHWQTAEAHPPDLQGIGIALWLTWRSDHVRMTLALAQQVCIQQISPQPVSPQVSTLPLSIQQSLLPLAGLLGGFATPPFPWSSVSGLDRSTLTQYSDRLFRAWAGACAMPEDVVRLLGTVKSTNA